MLWCFSWSGPQRTAERRNTNTLSALRNAQSLLLTHEVNKTPPRELLVVSSIIFAPLKKKKKYEKNTYQHCKKLFPCLEHKRAHLWNDLLWAPIGTESDLALIKKIKQPVHPCRAKSYVKTDFGVRHFCFSSSQEKEVILLPWVFPLLWHRLTGTEERGERKGKVLLRPDQPRTLQVSINHWTGYLKRVSLWSDGDAEWRSVFLKCLLREIFRMFSHLRSSDTKCCFVTAHARKSLTSVYAPTYKPCSRNPSCTSSASSSSSWLGNKRPFHSKILWIYEL